MISKLRMLTERPYAEGVTDSTLEVLEILRTVLSYSTDREIVNALTAFVVGTETVLATGSPEEAEKAFNQVRSLNE